MPRNPPWTRDELILALDLYFRIGMGKRSHPDVIELSHVLNQLSRGTMHPDPARFRNPNGVQMKLANFAALDPAYPGVALQRGGHQDAQIWEEFHHDRERLARLAAQLRRKVANS